jgi:hypothetical protein
MKQFRHGRGIVPTQSEPISTRKQGVRAMTALKFGSIESSARALPARLRPADVHAPRTAGQMAGPFEVAADERKGPDMRDALMTGLLVLYPAFAAVAAIVAGLFLTGASGT